MAILSRENVIQDIRTQATKEHSYTVKISTLDGSNVDFPWALVLPQCIARTHTHMYAETICSLLGNDVFQQFTALSTLSFSFSVSLLTFYIATSSSSSSAAAGACVCPCLTCWLFPFPGLNVFVVLSLSDSSYYWCVVPLLLVRPMFELSIHTVTLRYIHTCNLHTAVQVHFNSMQFTLSDVLPTW